MWRRNYFLESFSCAFGVCLQISTVAFLMFPTAVFSAYLFAKVGLYVPDSCEVQK